MIQTNRISFWRVGVAASVALVCGSASAADWPQYRGPERSGTVGQDGLRDHWAEGQPSVVWRQSIGTGYSAVSVVGDRLYTMDADDEQEHVLCLDADTGETVWRLDAGPFVQAELGDGGPRSTPTVAGGVVYAISYQARVMALDATDGSLIWDKDLTDLGPVPRFGYAISPLVDGDLVLIELGKKEEGPGVAALDRKTGEIRWSALNGPTGYSSAIIAEIAGIRQYVIFRAIGREVVGLSTGGEVLWQWPAEGALSAIPMPIFLPPDRLFVSTSEDAFGGVMLRISESHGTFSVDEVWSERLMRNHFNTSVLVNGHLYGFDNGTFRCLDAETGERRWAKRGFGKGSLIAAGELLYVLSDGGLVALVHATAEKYEEAGRLQVMEGRSWTAPSLANGRLYLRDFDEIVSVDVGSGSEGVGKEGAP